MKYDYDLAVIGAGTAGLVSSVIADTLGAKVALIEKERVGGECLWTGCVPSKTLIRSAKVRELVGRSEEFGVHVEKPRVVWSALKLRIADVRDEIRRLERAELDKSSVEVVQGTAHFQDAHTLRITGKSGERTLTARKFILATGSQARIPNIPGLSETPYLTYRDVYTLPTLPRSMGIIGGGPIACEFAQAFTRLGCKVTVFQSEDRLLPRDDPEASAVLQLILENEGVAVHLGSKVESVSSGGADSSATVTWHKEGESQNATFARLLVAVGKTHDWSELNPSAAGVQADEHGLTVTETLQTTAKHIWACGDATGGPLYTHWAEHEAKIAAQNALLPVKAKRDQSALPWVTYTDPEVAHVGLTSQQARAAGEEVKVVREPFKRLDRAIIEGETSGFLQVVTSGSGRILGATLVGPSAGELLAPWILAVRNGMLLSEFADAIFPYPTLSEIGHRAGNSSYQELLQNKWVKKALNLLVR